MFDGLVPAGVVTVATTTDRPARLYPEELRALGDAVPRRRAEFTAARACAREALGRLGVAEGPIGAGRHGEPLWPDGIVGSITHTDGYRAVAVAKQGAVAALGIDVEPSAPLPAGVLEVISAQGDRVDDGRLLFSAKESVYKAWFALTGDALTWADACVVLDRDRFTATLTDGTRLDGRWARSNGHLATAVVIGG